VFAFKQLGNDTDQMATITPKYRIGNMKHQYDTLFFKKYRKHLGYVSRKLKFYNILQNIR
jgi:hypothetical protein